MGFCQKWEVKFSYVQNWLAFAKVGGTVKSKYGQACTSAVPVGQARVCFGPFGVRIRHDFPQVKPLVLKKIVRYVPVFWF